MVKETKRKLRYITVVLGSLLLLSITYSSLIANAHAVELTPREKGLAALNSVVGLDFTKYTTMSKEYPPDSYLGVVPQETARYNLEADESKLDVLCTFVNGSLQMMSVLENDGLPITTRSATNAVDMAKDFLSSYRSYSGNSFYGGLASTLNNVAANETLTSIIGNIKLDVTNSAGSSTFRWTYTFEGIEAPVKCLVLKYDDGFLKYFIDNWNLYKIGSTSINLSEKEATDKGLASSKNFSWMVGFGDSTYEVRDFNATQAMVWETIFSNSLSAGTARDHDPLTLYPMRHVWVSLDKFYFGNVYGIEVYLWADTKDVYDMQERFSTLDPPADLIANFDSTAASLSSQAPINAASCFMPLTLVGFPILTIATGSALFWLGRRRSYQKPKSLKIGVILLCLMLSSTILLIPIATVNAKEPVRGVYIWGSRSSGANDTRLGATWRKTSEELAAQQSVATNISNYFSNNGYNTSNFQGPGSLKAQILDNISHSQGDYHTAVVDFDHGIYGDINGYHHYRFEDDNGTKINNYPGTTVAVPNNAVYDEEIYSETGSGANPSNVFFAFINTCLSGNLTWQGVWPDGSIVGMPFAWTHKIVEPKNTTGFNVAYHMSQYGYSDADDGAYVYLGFPWGSAALNQSVQDDYPNKSYASWLKEFFAYAFNYDMSVNEALDHASYSCFYRDFSETDLYSNFIAVWPIGRWNETSQSWYWDNLTQLPGSYLAVYGNGNIHLKGFSDNFNDNSVDAFRWDKLQASATVNEVNNRLEVTIPSGGQNQAQAGYVSSYAYNLSSSTTSVQVVQLNNVDEMTLQICNTKVTSSDPDAEDNFYRILKLKEASAIYVQQRISGSKSTLANTAWDGSTGTLKIEVAYGTIYFFEDTYLRYWTDFSLPSYICYIYVFTSSTPAYYGTDAFDDFALTG
jgi:hypothetical protein